MAEHILLLIAVCLILYHGVPKLVLFSEVVTVSRVIMLWSAIIGTIMYHDEVSRQKLFCVGLVLVGPAPSYIATQIKHLALLSCRTETGPQHRCCTYDGRVLS